MFFSFYLQKESENEDFTFHEVADERTQVVGLLLLALTYLHHIRQILTDFLQHLAAHLHFTLKEPEQRILVFVCVTHTNKSKVKA